MRMSDSDRPTACDDRLEETGSSASRFAGINQADGLESMQAGSEWEEWDADFIDRIDLTDRLLEVRRGRRLGESYQRMTGSGEAGLQPEMFWVRCESSALRFAGINQAHGLGGGSRDSRWKEGRLCLMLLILC